MSSLGVCFRLRFGAGKRELIRPGTHAAASRNCASRSRWGTNDETGQQWLHVTQNGVGMTDDVIKNYFTQIGKSYYHRFATKMNQRPGKSVV